MMIPAQIQIDLRSRLHVEARFNAVTVDHRQGNNSFGKVDEKRTLEKVPSAIINAKPTFNPDLLPVWVSSQPIKVE
jgi:hypothetical protein